MHNIPVGKTDLTHILAPESPQNFFQLGLLKMQVEDLYSEKAKCSKI